MYYVGVSKVTALIEQHYTILQTSSDAKMAQEILNNLLDFKISPKELLEWLTTDDYSDLQCTNFNKSCSREEFITFFLNYLRNQFTSVLQTANATKQTPAKKILVQPRANNSITPLTGKESSKCKKRVELTSTCSSDGQNINPAFQESIEHEKIHNMVDSKNISFDDSSFPSLGSNNSSSLNISKFSKNAHQSEPSELYNSNISQISNFSLSNKILQSPISPMYTKPVSMISPINAKGFQNKCHNSPSNNSHFQENCTGTPERTPKNLPKNSKNRPRSIITLSDFIVEDTRSSKKGSGKKNKKIVLKGEPKKDSDQQSALSGTSSTHLECNTRRRKVNPTRLNLTDEKGNKENTVFGVVTRPFTQNPQFVKVSPIDKSTDNESFQVERGLVKMERQKKPETITNKITDKNSSEEQTQTKIFQRTRSKVIKTGSVIIPNKELVENSQVLDVLAELYSSFLDYNLIVNPMSELYFIIHLISIQYTNSTVQCSSTIKNINEKVQNDKDEKNNLSSDIKTNVSILRKSLNFDDFGENKTNESIKSNDEDNTSFNKSSDQLRCSDLAENVEINSKIKETTLNKNIGITRENEKKEIDIIKNCVKPYYLGTPHNCVYFATQVLNYQKIFLKCLDRVTLKLLCENNQIAVFQPDLCKYLDTIYSSKVAEFSKNKTLLNIGMVELNVCFQVDTDNREKFSSCIAFSNFRTQRDMFYEILKIWDDNHLVPGWTFPTALNSKIKSMLAINTDITNLIHFTRLFKSQMLISCIQSEPQEDAVDNETLNFLKNLKDINPEKLTQLQKKLVTPLSQNGPVPLPSFTGKQEFYKDFILYASTPMFCSYLEDTFINEIMELNDSQFFGSDIEETETEVDEQTKQNFVLCLSSLRLLSKFLGFIISLPYKSETSMQEDVISSQVALRSKCLPRIDLQYCLQSAVLQGKLSLTVPWVVEYLAMMDHASLRLPCYKKVLEMLYCIYRGSNHHSITNSEELMGQKTAILVKLVIGWLFELPAFPKELYYSWQSKYNDKALKMICEKQQAIINNENNLTEADTSVVSIKHCLFLDKLEMIDDMILYSCCPYLRELNILLTPGNSNANNTTSYKHVTPVTSLLHKPVKKTNTKHLEIQLEEAFFHGQPMSTRKTVEYVSERIASSCIKYIYNNLLPVEKKNNYDALKQIVKENYSEALEKSPELVKNALLKDMNSLASTAAKNVKEKSEQVVPKICESRIAQSIESLLAEDCLKPVKIMCAKIATRMATERIDQWLQSHIIGSSTFIKDMEFELTKAFKNNDEVVVDKKCHNSNAACPTDVLDDMRKLIWDLLETKGKNITVEMLAVLCDNLYESVTERSDLRSGPEKIILLLSLDLCLFLIAYRDDLFTPKIQTKVCKVWKIEHLKFTEADSPLAKILCPRNITLMAQPANNKVWLSYGKFLKKLLKENILSIDVLSDEAITIFTNGCPIPKGLSTCLKEAIVDFRSVDEETEKTRYLLNLVAEACNDTDFNSFCFN